jgi:uncharacterized protein YeaO (DUF488 family)
MTGNEIDLWLKGIAPENRLALTFLHTPFNSPHGQIKRDDAAGEIMEAERAFIGASLQEWR